MEYLTRPRGRLGLNSIVNCDPDGTILASAISSRGMMRILRYSARVKGSNGGPDQPFWIASKTTVLAFWVITSMGLSSPASIRTEGLVQCPCFVCTGCSCLAILDREGNSIRLQVICIREIPFLGHFAGQCRSISVMMSSAHRTVSEMAATVAGTRLPPSHCASFLGARIAAAMSSTRLHPSSTRACYNFRHVFATEL